MKLDDLSENIKKALQEYSEGLTVVLKNSTPKTAKKYAKKLKEVSPKLTGDYSRGWREKELKDGRYESVYVIYNKDEYPLTHLLEYGHLSRNGKRVAARPHIKKVENEAIEELTKVIEDEIK